MNTIRCFVDNLFTRPLSGVESISGSSVYLSIYLSVITSYSFPSDSKLTQHPPVNLNHATSPTSYIWGRVMCQPDIFLYLSRFFEKKYKNSEKIPFLNTFCSMFIAVCWKQFAVTLQHIAMCGEFSHAQFKAQTVYTEENQPTNLCKILHTMIFSRLCLSCVCSSGNSDVRNLCYSISSPQSAVEGGGTTWQIGTYK